MAPISRWLWALGVHAEVHGCTRLACCVLRLRRLRLRLEIQSPHAPPSVAPHSAPDPSPATLQDASAAVHPAGRAGRAGGLGLGASAAVRPSVTLTHLAKEAHEAEIHAIVIYATERFVSASVDATIRAWDARTLAPLYTLRARGRLEPIAHDGAVYALLLVTSPTSPPSPAGSAAGLRLLSGGGDRLIRVWELASLEQQATLAGHRSFVCALAADAHRQRLFSASSDKTCIVWHLGTYERLRVLAGHRGGRRARGAPVFRLARRDDSAFPPGCGSASRLAWGYGGGVGKVQARSAALLEHRCPVDVPSPPKPLSSTAVNHSFLCSRLRAAAAPSSIAPSAAALKRCPAPPLDPHASHAGAHQSPHVEPHGAFHISLSRIHGH